jgi:hypothetical protein
MGALHQAPDGPAVEGNDRCVPWQFITPGSPAATSCGIKGILAILARCRSCDAVQPVARVAEPGDDEALLVEV